jgi:hypothetical protein
MLAPALLRCLQASGAGSLVTTRTKPEAGHEEHQQPRGVLFSMPTPMVGAAMIMPARCPPSPPRC